MKFSKLNIIIAIGFLAIIGVVIMQLLMLNQAYKFEKRDMEDKIHFALQDVLVKIYKGNKSDIPITNQIKKISDNYYTVNVDDVFENNILEHYLHTEFSKVKLELDFEYAIYDCSSDKMVYGKYVSFSGKNTQACKDCFTKNSDLTYYFSIRFPDIQKAYFMNLKPYWIYTLVLLLLLAIYVYSVMLMLKQKRYTELQKDFVNNMTHEFKTPLASILIASDYVTAQEEIKKNAKLTKYIEIIKSQTAKLNQHIEKILYVAKTDSKQVFIEKTEVNLKNILANVQENILLKHPKNIIFETHIDKDYLVIADEFHFYNTLFNLADNAVKYADNPRIQITTKLTNNALELQFKDNGKGIPEEDIPFIFDKFYRVSRKDSKDIEGFGIGLSYVKRICQLHKWTIKLYNNQDTGVTVTIYINKNDIII